MLNLFKSKKTRILEEYSKLEALSLKLEALEVDELTKEGKETQQQILLNNYSQLAKAYQPYVKDLSHSTLFNMRGCHNRVSFNRDIPQFSTTSIATDIDCRSDFELMLKFHKLPPEILNNHSSALGKAVYSKTVIAVIKYTESISNYFDPHDSQMFIFGNDTNIATIKERYNFIYNLVQTLNEITITNGIYSKNLIHLHTNPSFSVSIILKQLKVKDYDFVIT